MSLIDTLAPLRAHGNTRTTGLDDATVLDFAKRDAQREITREMGRRFKGKI